MRADTSGEDGDARLASVHQHRVPEVHAGFRRPQLGFGAFDPG